MNLTKDQVNTILNNAPIGTDKKAILDGLIQRGYDLEGVDNNAVRQSLQSKPQEKGSIQQLGENIANLPNQVVMNRGQEALGFIENQPKLAEQAGGSPLAKIASYGATAGHLAGTVARGVGDIFGAIISPFIPKQAQEVIGNVASEINSKVDSIPGMTPEIKKHMEDVFDTVTLLGGKKVEPVIKNATEQGIKNTVNVGKEVSENVIKTGQEVAGKVKEGIQPTITAEKALGQISQGKTSALSPLKETLKTLDTTGVKTYSDFASKIESKIPELAKKVDNELLKDTTPARKISAFTETIGTGKNTVKVNYVDQAIKDLNDYYIKTNDVNGLVKIKEIQSIANTKGLTYKDVNDLAKLHGQEISAFNLNGEAASGLTKQAAENTRTGLKNIARQGLGGPEAQALDRQLSNLFDTKKLVQNNVEAVNKLKQKIEERGWVSQATYKIVKALDTISGGGIRGITDALLNRGTGLKTLNALDIEKNLTRNLEIIKKALQQETEKGLQDIIK